MSIDARTEKFEHIELFGKPALFTNGRIDRDTIPDGWYCYDFRGSDNDPGKLNCVELRVGVNHSGAVLLPEEIDMKGKDYHTTERYYKNVGKNGFTEESHILLRDILLSSEMKGKFLLSYNDDPFVRELYDHPGIYIEPITRLNNIRQRYEPSCQFSELFISNYDTSERGEYLKRLELETTQLTLFDQQTELNDEEELFYEIQSMP